MLQFESWKKLLVLFVIALGVVYALPNVLPSGENRDSGLLPGQQINLGLDLQGGSHLLMLVDMEVVETERLNSLGETIRQEFRNGKIRFSDLRVEDRTVSVSLRRADDTDAAKLIFAELGRGLIITSEGQNYRISFDEAGLTEMRNQTIEQSMEIIRRRIDPDGTKEPIIQRQGKDRVLVQLPGVDDPETIKRLLGRTAKLTFQLVDTSLTGAEAITRGRVPPGSVLLPGDGEDSQSYVVEKRVMVSGEMLDGATASFDQNNRPSVSFNLNATGAKKFGRVTGANIGRPLSLIHISEPTRPY